MAGDGLGAPGPEGNNPDEQILRDILGDNAAAEAEVGQLVELNARCDF